LKAVGDVPAIGFGCWRPAGQRFGVSGERSPNGHLIAAPPLLPLEQRRRRTGRTALAQATTSVSTLVLHARPAGDLA
jgi:hypothetical protein